MTLTKKIIVRKSRKALKDLISSKDYSSSSKLDLEKSKDYVDTLLEVIKKNLENGEDILISGFGKFCIQEKAERKGRNPNTSKKIQIEARRIVTFKTSRELRNAINLEHKKVEEEGKIYLEDMMRPYKENLYLMILEMRFNYCSWKKITRKINKKLMVPINKPKWSEAMTKFIVAELEKEFGSSKLVLNLIKKYTS